MSLLSCLRRIGKIYIRELPADSFLSTMAYILQNFHPTVTTILLAALFQNAYDFVQNGTGQSALWSSAGLLIAYYFVYEILFYISSLSINVGIYEKGTYLLNNKLIEAESKMSMAAFDDENKMKAKKMAEECVHSENIPAVFMLLIVTSTSIAGVISLIITLAMYHPLLAAVAFGSVLQFGVARWMLGREKYRLDRSLTDKKRMLDYIWSLFVNKKSVKEMRIMGFSDYLVGKWDDLRDDVNQQLWSHEKKGTWYELFCDLLKTLGYVTGIGLGIYLLHINLISVGAFGACLAAFVSVQTAIENFFSSIGKIPGLLHASADYFLYIEQMAEDGIVSGEKLEKIHALEFKNVSFAYGNQGIRAIQNVSFSIERGKTICIVGTNGSGKTTLIRLLLGLYTQKEGEILINGKDRNLFDIDSFYEKVGLLSQDFEIYPFSVRENIALARLDQLEQTEKMERVIKEMQLEEVLPPPVYEDMMCKEFGGIELSKGQKQRIALARVIFADKEVIILDEPTSALDPLQETYILKEFLHAARGKTAIIISHRVGVCRYADAIAVMKEGKLVEFGNHDELMKRRGEYADLFQMQSHWYEQ